MCTYLTNVTPKNYLTGYLLKFFDIPSQFQNHKTELFCLIVNALFVCLPYIDVGACPEGYLECAEGKCLPPEAICNGVVQCVGGVDEKDCGKGI